MENQKVVKVQAETCELVKNVYQITFPGGKISLSHSLCSENGVVPKKGSTLELTLTSKTKEKDTITNKNLVRVIVDGKVYC